MRLVFAAAEQNPPQYASVNEIFGREMVGRGHDVTAVLYGKRRGVGTWAGGNVHTVPRPIRAPLSSAAGSAVSELASLWQIFGGLPRMDAVIVRDDPIMALAAALHRARLGPLVYQISHLNPEEILEHAREGYYGSPWANRIKASAIVAVRAMALRAAKLVIVMTPEAGDALSIEEDKRLVLGEGVARDWRPDVPPEQARAEAGLGDGPLVLYAGTLNRVRHLEDLVAAHAILRRRVHATLVIAGRGRDSADEAFVASSIARSDVADSVKVIGPQSSGRVAALLDASAVAISPIPSTAILRCNSPVKVFEAMHRATPLVASDIPEQRRVLTESGGGEIVAHDPRRYADALARYLEQPRSAAEAGARGRAWVLEHRTYERLAATLDERLRAMIGEVRAA